MLVLSRKIREQIDIPELGIRFTVLSVGTNRVQVGIEAPEHIQITRPEANKIRRRPEDRSPERPTVKRSSVIVEL